jgi:4a-hydroxytetrahydrobiopterin dehydratase
MSLAENQCIPCKGGVPSLEASKIQELLGQLEAGWALNAAGHLEREYTFPNFAEAWRFLNKVAEVAEDQNHHPDLFLAWGKCKVEIWTHKIKGLTESDFYFAAKADRAYSSNG